jgi:hypothetical protein
MSSLPPSPNPYDAPYYGGQNQPYPQQITPPYAPYPPKRASALPTFCFVIFILDLVFCGLRIPLVALSMVGAQMAQNDPMVARTGSMEILTGAAIALFGISAGVAFLCKQKWGAILGWLTCLATLASIGVGVWQASYMIDKFPANSPQRIGAVVGGGISCLVRLALLGLYAFAIVKFVTFAGSRREPATIQGDFPPYPQ